MAGETLEQFGERVAIAVRRRFMDTLDDDVIARIGKSHVIFGQACAMEAVETAMRESMAARLNDGAGTGELPEVLPGHWTTPGGRDMALATLGDPHMARSRERISDFALANEVFLSPGIANLTDAKERIRWLSARLALAASPPAPANAGNPVAALERLKRERLCGGDDCTEYDHGVDEGIDVALAEVRKAAPADASGEVDRLRAERDYLLKRAGRAGSASWGTQRWTGMSSNALVDVAFGVENGCLPSDQNDLSACYLTVLRMPDHLISEAVLAQLEAGERAVGESDWARENAQWPGADAIRARIAQEPRP